MASDKKARGAAIRFIGISNIGEPVWLEEVTADQIATAYERIAL